MPIPNWRYAATALALAVLCGCARTSVIAESRIELATCQKPWSKEPLRCGTYDVFEDRVSRKGRKLRLAFVIVPAKNGHPAKDPIFWFTGGPGQTASETTWMDQSWMHDEHDIVMLDERGTSAANALDCRAPGTLDNLQGYFELPYSADIARACARDLGRVADLTQYSTAASVEDTDEVRRALGYDRINVVGASFGTYAALMYMRAHPDSVRSAVLYSMVIPANRVPLKHAAGAQRALDRIITECEKDAACHATYPQFREEFAAVLARVRAGSVQTTVPHPVSKAPTPVTLSEPAFVDAVRVLLYDTDSAHTLPDLVHHAFLGDFAPIAAAGFDSSYHLYPEMRLGLTLAITCTEFTSRIDPGEIDRETKGSFLGAWRVRGQVEACREWPRTRLPAGFLDPFTSKVPTLIVSGDSDPVTPPEWGEATKAFLPNAIHAVVPGGHVPYNECAEGIAAAVVRAGRTPDIDLACLRDQHPPPFKPAQGSA
jgi:pimeloyl-ACP methyl ester carboxylesterase